METARRHIRRLNNTITVVKQDPAATEVGKMTEIDPELVTREALRTWLLDYHDSTATLDAQLVADKFFTNDIECQFGNNPLVSGKETVLGFFESAFKGLDVMTHEIVYFDFVAPNKLYQAATIKYVVKGDDSEQDMIVIPAMMTAWLGEDAGALKIRKMEIYLDASALFSRMQQKSLI